MELQDIEEAIKQFEGKDPTANNVQELACLYTVRNNLAESSTAKELNDILPEYNCYCQSKRKFQQHQLTEDGVIHSMQGLCKELKEFIYTLYNCTDFYKERKLLLQTLEDLHTELNIGG